MDLTEGDIIMIALTVFFGIFIITAAIWGPLYFLQMARRRQEADPEVQAADSTPDERRVNEVRSDRTTVGYNEAVPLRPSQSRFVSLRQWLGALLTPLFRMRRERASPPSEERSAPFVLGAGSRFDDTAVRTPENHELDELGPNDQVSSHHLVGSSVSGPAFDGHVNIAQIYEIVELRARRASFLVPDVLNHSQQLNMAEVQHGGEQQGVDDDLELGPFRPEYGDGPMATITKSKTC